MTAATRVDPLLRIAVERLQRVLHEDGRLAVEEDVAAVGVAPAAELSHLTLGLGHVLVAERDRGEGRALRVLERNDRRGRDRLARRELADLEILQLEQVLADLRHVGGVAVERLDRPARVRRRERDLLRAADLDARDVRDRERGEDLLAHDGGRLHLLARRRPVRDAAEHDGHRRENYEVLACHVSAFRNELNDVARCRASST